MKKLMLSVLCSLVLAGAARAESSLGFGPRAFRTVDSLYKPFTDSGFGGFVNWRSYWNDWAGWMAELSFYEEGFAGSKKEVLSPQAFLVLGRDLYAAVGGGYLYGDGNFSDSPFLALRAGVQGALTTWFMFDVYLGYEFAEWKGVNTIDERFESDTVVLGAGLRLLF